jgi:hypothetical protein
VIHYHGTPITPESAGAQILAGRHAMVSFAHPEQLPLVAEVCQSFALDNGAFTLWRAGKGKVDVMAYRRWVGEWLRHPGFDWCLIPDVIDGSEAENDELIDQWARNLDPAWSVPVWHLHESPGRLRQLASQWPRVAIGSSGDYAVIGSRAWWERMGEAMAACCVNGKPTCKLHGLRMLDPDVFRHFPFSSADSTNVARNVGLDGRWDGTYAPAGKAARGIVLAGRIEAHQSAAKWTGAKQEQLFESA